TAVQAPSKPKLTAMGSPVSLQPHRLMQVLYAALAAVVVLSLLSLAVHNWWVGGQLLSTGLLLGFTLRYAQQGRTQAAANLMLATLVISVSILIFRSQGLRDEAVCAFPGIMIFAGMFTTRRVFVVMTGFIFLVLGLVTLTNMTGWHVNYVPQVTMFSLLNIVTVLLVTAFFVW